MGCCKFEELQVSWKMSQVNLQPLVFAQLICEASKLWTILGWIVFLWKINNNIFNRVLMNLTFYIHMYILSVCNSDIWRIFLAMSGPPLSTFASIGSIKGKGKIHSSFSSNLSLPNVLTSDLGHMCCCSTPPMIRYLFYASDMWACVFWVFFLFGLF